MKKTALVTCYFMDNYGSVLQAYATQKLLDDKGIENETINIENLLPIINKRKMGYFVKNIVRPDIIREKSKTIKKKIVEKTNKNNFGTNLALRKKEFRNFRKCFHLTEAFHSFEELSSASEKYKNVIIGSDQLWLPSNIAGDYYTLNWVPETVSKISFATSFGISALDKHSQDRAVHFLRKFDAISVREKSGADIVKSLIGLEPKIVCDPTLMFGAEEWTTFEKETNLSCGNYIFCYFIGNNREHRQFVRKLKKLTGYKIVGLLHIDEYIKSDEMFVDEALYGISPDEFVSLIHNAAYVCTDSFHCTVFSVMFEKNFFVFKRFQKNTSVSTNSRIFSLLKILELEHRLVEDYDDLQKYMSQDMDFTVAAKNIKKLKKVSLDFLDTALH